MKIKTVFMPLIVSAFTVTLMADDIKSSINIGMFESAHKAMKKAKITMSQAIEAAKTKETGRVEKAELEEEDGYLIYKIKMIDSYENETKVIIDPVTAKVLDVDKDG